MSSAGFISTCILAMYVAIVWDKNANDHVIYMMIIYRVSGGSYCPFAVKKSRRWCSLLMESVECDVHPTIRSSDDTCLFMQSVVCFIQFRLQYSHGWICSIQSHPPEVIRAVSCTWRTSVTSFIYIFV